MSKTFDQGKDEIAALCRYFERNKREFLASDFKEAQVRQTLIDPLFEALGWDVRNSERAAPQYREVVPEPSLDVEGQQRAPDYAFRVGSQTRFYAEAKKCGVKISADPAPAYQIRRYGWSANLALSILTDFEELAVFDCSARPRPKDKATHARIQYFGFKEYPGRWRELWDVFSREAVWSGAFDQYAASKRKRGTSEVDVEFLKEIEGWREALARNIALRNKDISPDDLNAAVQMTIDRVVFLRMAEDRGLESQEQLLKLCDRSDIYQRFICELCTKADAKYNSGLFHFQNEAGATEAPDRITPKLVIDDKSFKPILEKLYFAHGSPYDFGVMPVEILGTVYERFLGKVIRLTAGHQAKIEEKPEVRKAGGVYYTPAYIVDYIVRQTVRQRIDGKSPAQLAGSKDKATFRVLDMACGSGSFLLGAYRCLLDYCLAWHIDHNPETLRKAVYKDPRSGAWRLTIEEKKRILTTHIFGVDIDRQAVEVSKLSLLLKALEGESEATLSAQMMLFEKHRALPNLANNIKCGNSLIGPSYFTNALPLDPNDRNRINAFSWKSEFPDAHREGGFDCIIGNPPYIRIQTMKEWAPVEVDAYKELYRTAREGNYDIYVVFLERGLELLTSTGRLGFICPHKFFNANYGAPLRTIVSKGRHLRHVVHFGDQQVFEGATTYTCLLFLEKPAISECRFVKVNDLAAWRSSGAGGEAVVKAEQVTAQEWNFTANKGAGLFHRLIAFPHKLGDIAHLFVGLQTDADDVFILEQLKTQGNRVLCSSKATGREHWFENEHLKPLLKGSVNIRRYFLDALTKRLIFPYETKNGKSVLISAKEYKRDYPLTWSYLEDNHERLAGRKKGQMGREWHGYVYKKNHTRFSDPKLVVPSLAIGSCFAADFEGKFYFVGSGAGGGGGYGITLNADAGLSPSYLLGILNSKLLSAAIKETSTPFRGGYFALNRQYIERLPIRMIDKCKESDVELHEKVSDRACTMLCLRNELAAAGSESQRCNLQRQIDAVDQEIDSLVYELYGLTAEEIAIVEGLV